VNDVVHHPREADDWARSVRWQALDDVCLGVFDCPHSTPKLTDAGPFVVRSQDIRTGVFRLEEAGHVSEATYRERIARAEPRHGDLLYSREGTYFGIAAEVPEGVEVCLGQRMVLIRPNPTKAEARFLRYWLNSPIMGRHLEGFRDGSVAQRLNLPTIRRLAVPIIPTDAQRQIGEILGALDDKIELNRRMAETLEAMARALYRSWFVDFDPVHAKALGRAPAHMDAATAALFPDRFGEDGLPKGWSLKRVGDILTLAYGKALRKDARVPGRFPVFGSGGTDSSHNAALVSAETIVVGRKGTVGTIYWAPDGCWPIDTTFFVSSDLPMAYLLRLLEQLPLSDMNTDAAVPGLNRDNAYRLEVAHPESAIVDAYSSTAGSLQKRIDSCGRENRTLAALRDALLPKLMSGEIRVRDAEAAVEEAVA
jgi:type I restriction enzyme S subunit